MRNNNYPFYPNVDLYAPIIYKIAGLKEEGILSLFIIARIGGWAAHIIEQKNGPNHLLRPRLSYIGSIKNYDAKINT